MKSIKAVFWDVDGTLADTEMDGHRIAFNQAFNEFNLNWNWDISLYADLLEITGGVNRIKHYADTICLNMDANTASQIHHSKQTFYIHLVENGVISLRVGVKRLIGEIQKEGIEQWIVTTSSKRAVDSLIRKQFDLSDNPFSGVISGDDVKLKKPSPEAYLKAINLCNYESSEIIVIEDSLPGYSSATKSNLNTIMTLTPWNKTPIDKFINSFLIVDSLGDVNTKSLIYKPSSQLIDYISFNYIRTTLEKHKL